ncbi:hypothetical protein CPB97_009818 [Podila verticillata]|nr:hypothetical protein CPB97_009818 [Podila verticillata]
MTLFSSKPKPSTEDKKSQDKKKGVKLFNDIITVLDVLPSNPTVDICVNHPSTVAIVGKVRIIAKRPCAYKSLVLTATGHTRISRRTGTRLQAQQLFFHATTDIIHQSPHPTTTDSTTEGGPTPSAPTSPVSSPQEENAPNSSGGILASYENESTQSPEQTSISSTSPQVSTDHDTTHISHGPQMTFATNQLHAGVNDIDFRLEFPSHYKSHLTCPRNEVHLHSLPSGSIRTPAQSILEYSLRTTLTLSRRDVLVNNSLSVTIPFRIQTWQDQIDQSHSEENAYHGRRRGKIEFEFHVPKQLDAKRLHELHFGFQGGWRVLDDRLKVDKVHFYIIEEEVQTFVPRAGVETYSSIISTTATYDCAESTTPTNAWEYLDSGSRLQIPQPNLVQQPIAMPDPGIFAVTHKLRVLIQFDKRHKAEKDLQLSFPILIHPTLDNDGGPIHPELTEHAVRPHRHSRGRRSQRVGALYISNSELMEGGSGGGDDDDDDDILPLPTYADREGNLLLMVGEEVQDLDYMNRQEMDALGISVSTTTDSDLWMSSEEASSPTFSPVSPPLSPLSSAFASSSPGSTGTTEWVGATAEQHSWALYNNNNNNSNRRSQSMSIPPSSPSTQEGPSRRMSSMPHFSPPPYIFPNEEAQERDSLDRRTHMSERVMLSSSLRRDANIPQGLPSPPYERLDEEWQSTLT